MTSHHRRLLFKKWARTLHIYLSLFGLITVFFFAATGFVLNHDDWFGLDASHVEKLEGKFPLAMLREPDKLAVVEKLRADFRAGGTLASFDVQGDQLQLVFKAPGHRTDAVINRQTGQAEINREVYGLMARLGDLHRGTNAGRTWRILMDVTCLLIVISSLTGITLWLLVPKWRPWGVAALIVSGLLTLAIYFALVP
jgi:hypothetical protein